MGPMEVPSQSPETIKIPTAHYEFGANFIDPKVLVICIFFYDRLNLNCHLKIGCHAVDAFWENND